jgi:hypothetical protein
MATKTGGSVAESIKFPVFSRLSGILPAETGSQQTASSASKSLFLQIFSVSREIRANTARLRRVASSPRLEFDNDSPDFGVCLCRPISASRFHGQLSGE